MAPGTAGHHTNASWYKFRKIELQTQVHILKQISLGSRTQMQSDTIFESRWTFFNCFPFIDVAGQQHSIKGWNIFLRWKFHLELIVLEGIYKHQARKGAPKVSKKSSGQTTCSQSLPLKTRLRELHPHDRLISWMQLLFTFKSPRKSSQAFSSWIFFLPKSHDVFSEL